MHLKIKNIYIILHILHKNHKRKKKEGFSRVDRFYGCPWWLSQWLACGGEVF
jgi:hypothetical protein